MAKIILKEIAKIVIVAVKSYGRILVLVVMRTVRRSYSGGWGGGLSESIKKENF